MVTLFQLKYHLFRSKAKSLLLLATTILLLGSTFFYVNSIRSNQEALDKLAETVPVSLSVRDSSGTWTSHLSIPANLYDSLLEGGVHDVLCTGRAVGSFSEKQDSVQPGEGQFDTAVSAANSLSALDFMNTESIQFLSGWDESFFSGNDAVCIMSESFANTNNLQMGDSFAIPLFTQRIATNGSTYYTPLGNQRLTIIGIAAPSTNRQLVSDIFCPVTWLRTITEDTGLAFTYSSISAVVNDPMNLNSFKEQMSEAGFINAAPNNYTNGDRVLLISDELFIKTARKLRNNISVFEFFLIPYFSLMVAVSILAIFLIFRNNRHEIALEILLGQSKLSSGLAYYLWILIITLIGCAISFPILLLSANILLSEYLLLCLTFFSCISLSAVVSLVLVCRFDTIALLTKGD